MSGQVVAKAASFHHSILQLSNGSVRKLIEPQYPFTPPEREALIKDMLEFRRRLHASGVPVAKDYNLSVQDGVIVEETVNCGVDGFKILKVDVASNGEVILRQIVRALREILLGRDVALVPDPHPANWCLDSVGRVRYIDFQPARFQRCDGLKLVGFPQPVGKEYEWSVDRYYSKAGLVRILRFNAMRAGGPKMQELLLRVMREEWPKHLFEEVSYELENFLEQKVRRGVLSVAEALNRCDELRVDDIRELAMIVSERADMLSPNFLDKVLEWTRVDFNISIDVRRQGVERAKSLVLAQFL